MSGINYGKTIDELTQLVNKFKKNQSKQKKDGLNDANMFTTLVNANKEIRHSRFLAFLLNPNGNHYRDDLFLKLFLQHIDLSGFGLNTKTAKVYLEYYKEVDQGRSFIDIYISDGTNTLL